MIKITFTSKTCGSYTTIVDDADYQRMKELKSLKWCIVKKRSGIYFQKRLPGSILVELHRWIMKPEKDKYVDHINGDTLDNRRENLRICTNSANIRNGKVRTNNKTGVTGVNTYVTRSGKRVWNGRIRVNYKIYTLGTFDTKEEAIKVRKKAEKKYWSY